MYLGCNQQRHPPPREGWVDVTCGRGTCPAKGSSVVPQKALALDNVLLKIAELVGMYQPGGGWGSRSL